MQAKLPFFPRSILLFTLLFAGTALAYAVIHDGQVDSNFDVTPAEITEMQSRVDTFVVLPDGKILVSGGFSSISGGRSNSIARLNADGSFDATFRGRSVGAIKGVFPLSNGQILVSGDFLQYDGVSRNRIARLNPDGSIDPTFAPNFGTDFVQIVAVQPDGKMIVNGTFTNVGGVPRIRVARLNPDGSLDLTFTVGNGLNNAGVQRGAVQPDGKIVFVGSFSSYNDVPRIGVLRLNQDGSLDTSFTPTLTGVNTIFDMSLAADGSVFVAGEIESANKIYKLTPSGAIDPTFNMSQTHTSSGRIYGVLAQPDGKVIIGGSFDSMSVNGTSHLRYRIFRFNSNGSVDTSFIAQAGSSFSSGTVRTFAMHEGKILVGGDYGQLNGVGRGGIGRLNIDSSLDQSFVGFLGRLTYLNTLHVYPDGKMLIGGGFHVVGTTFRQYVARLNADGSVDPTFNLDPLVNKVIYAIAIQPDGKILLGGFTGDSSFGGTLGKGLWRINPDGSLDATLDTQLGSFEAVRSIAVQPDGKILIAGQFTRINGVNRSVIARVNADGSLDQGFTPAVSSQSLAQVVLQPDGKILIGGEFNSINGSPIANFARLNSDGSLDPGFNIGGGANSAVSAFLLLPDNRIYVGGSFSTISGGSRSALARLLPNGQLDQTFRSPRISAAVGTIISLPNNKILVGGTTNSNIDAAPRREIIRLFEDGMVDFSFDVTGASINTSDGVVYKLGLQPDGSIIAVGQFDTLSGVARAGIARLLTFPRPSAPVVDFDGDGKTDISVFRPSTGVWHRLQSYFNVYRSAGWGIAGDMLTPVDFDGDFRTDHAVFRPSTGAWYLLNSSDNTTAVIPFGTQGDIAAPGDFDGDAKTDLGVFRPSDGNWWLNRSRDGVTAVQFGLAGDVPVASDYDGDGKTDVAIYRPSNGEWWMNHSGSGIVAATTFGGSGDKPVQGDYTGDRKTDIAFWRPSTGEWFVLRSEDYSYYAVPFGTNGDIPAPGDYDGDGKFDTTVFRPSGGVWYSDRSSAGILIRQFGLDGDRPVPSAFVP